MVIYKDVPVFHRRKEWHRHSLKGRIHRDFTVSWGEIPVCRFNEITKKFEVVINTRGLAYAARNRLKYQSKHNKLTHEN